MKSSGQKEESTDKKKYVFFSDPDVIAKRAETSAIAAQITRDAQWQTSDKQSDNEQVPTLGRKNLENLLSYHPVQPYPFTFISAVKQKLALGDRTDIKSTKAYNPSSQSKSSLTSSILKTNSTQNLYQIVQKMDFIRPLKVPDLKISPKTLDFSSRENSVSKELSSKSEIAAKEFAHDKSDKTLRPDRVQRKLDFSSDGSSIINSESIEPLKAPNVSIASNLSKKKEHVRDSSREKENRSKRLKKDDSSCTKRDEFAEDQVKRSRSPRHISRKDAIDMSNIKLSLPKNDRPFHTAKNNDYPSTKSKDKNFVMSSVKKDNDKRQRSFNVQSVELTRENLESKCRMSSNESPVFTSWKVPDKVTLRDNNIGILSNTAENKSKDVCHSKQRPDVEDSKHKSDSDNRQLKQDKSSTIHKEQTKRVSDKNKASNNKIEGTLHSIDSELSENIGTISETNSSKNRVNVYPTGSAQSSKGKDSETTAESKQSTNSARSAKTLESFKCKEHSAAQSAGTSTKNDEESYSQSTITTKESNTNDDSNDVDISTLPDTLFDPRRISFRDRYSPQDFHNLITPEKMNLMVRSKRRKYWIQNSDSEADARSKHKPIIKSEQEQSEVQLMHPTALHMQFQAELHLYDSYNESLRQIMDVEKCLYNTNREQEQKNLQKVNEMDEELVKIVQTGEDRAAAAIDSDAVGKTAWNPLDYTKKDIAETWRSSDEAHFNREHYTLNQGNTDESDINYGKFNKAVVKVAEVQTQTVNDMATQTDISANKRNTENQLSEVHTEATCEQSLSRENEVPQLSLDSAEQHEDLDQIEKMSLPNKIRTMSEISLHETTSSIKTETGTEISISTRDVTFNQFLDLEMARLIRDENQRCNKIEELFKFREKTLNDKTKKLMQLEEQKRVLKDTGQDSRSVKKKQRALILKLQQEKDEISRLKYLYVITSQERKLMLQKQRNMFNPQISTKNILTKLKRSADSQSPRRLSGPMKGYDIRSNSSMSSLIDSDKSQHDQSQVDSRLQTPKSFRSIFLNSTKECNTSATKFDDPAESKKLEKNPAKSQKKGDMSKYELRSRKYEEKMPRADILRHKQNQLDMESKRIQGHPMKIKRLLENQEVIGVPQSSKSELNVSIPDYVKSESDTLVEELSKRSRTASQVADPSVQTATILTEKDSTSNIVTANSESIEEEINTIVQDTVSKTTKSSQVSESMLQTNSSKNSKKIDKSVTSDKDVSKKLQCSTELKTSSKRKSSKYQKTKSSSNTLTENILQSKLSSHISEELIKHHDKRTKMENELSQLDINESSYESKENTYSQISNRKVDNDESSSRNERNVQNVSTSQIDTFAISHHSSGESEKNLSKSVVVRSKDRDFEQILSARETALTSRKNCVEEWMAWHARLRAEEDRVSRMEQAAFKLVAAASNVLSQQERGLCSFIDTTLSSDTSDVEGRIGLLTEKLAERRIEMARLKREAKRQAKKQLRALEANLLNQIKRYDTTIHEMRKKLETKKAIKETDKLAIEPKSLADFKVPEIPLKRIQDIYKSSDLLRSRSESDLLTTNLKNQQKDLLKIVTPVTYNKHERDSLQKSTKSADIKSTKASGLKSITDINHSSQTVLDEYTEVYDKIPTVTSVSLASNNSLSRKHALSIEKQTERSIDVKQSSVSRDAENSEKNFSTVRSELEVPTITDASTKSTDNRSISNTDRSQSKILTIQSETQEDLDYSKSIPSKSNYSTENIARITDSNILTYSRKLDYLQLNNKNLSEDISSIENDIKALSEIMSRLSNESNEKSKADNDERNTSQDISEMISKSVFSDKISNIANDEKKQTVSHEKEINTDSLSVSTNDRKSKSPNDSSRGNYISDKVNNEISATIPEEASILSNSARIEIDYEAKSKEIMNEIEKSIISEHGKETLDDYNTSLENENEELLNELISELDVKSISEILSKVSESRRSLDLATNAATEIISDTKKDRNVTEILEAEAVIDAKPLKNFDEDIQTPVLDETVNSVALASKVDQNQSHAISAGNISQDKNDWTTSDSFEVPQDEISTGEREEFEKSQSRLDDSSSNFLEKDVSAFIPKGESTKVEMHNVTIDNTLVESHVKTTDELDDILDIISRENNQEKSIFNEHEKPGVISDSMAELLEKVKDFAENNEKIEDNHFEEILQAAGDDKPVVNINLRVEIDNKESPREMISEIQEIIITELDSESIEDNVLSELEIDAKVELAEEEEPATSNANENIDHYVVEEKDVPIEIKECLESILEQDSSDGEQLDNLVEVAESGLATVEKLTSSRDSPESIIDNAMPIQNEEAKESTDDTIEQNDESVRTIEKPTIENLNKTFDILKDPEYEDISEESLEVSEILDKNELLKAGVAKKSANLPEKYQAVQKSEEVLRILDEISQKSSPDSISNSQRSEKDAQSAQSPTEEISELLGAEVSAEDDSSSPEMNRMTKDKIEEESYKRDESRNRALEGAQLHDKVEASGIDLSEEKSPVPSRLDEHNADDKNSQIIYELRERVSQLQEQDASSESSEAGDTPRGVSEIEMDSPRDFNDSRLDMDILDDDLLSGTKSANQSVDVKSNFHSASIVATSEKDIEAMIDKIKASLGQPGLEVSELEAKLLRIEQLQIELEIKKLEAEEVSYYVREIPNKPPPPYTPPGDSRLPSSLGSPSLVTAVTPTNVEELTLFTEKATTLIYNAKLAGDDIASLEAPPEIYDLTKDKNEAVRKDKRIYNTFLFDLCKETIVEVYRAEYEKPGPSWTKPNVKTKPTMKMPKTVEELIEYVNKEVATLFGFKTKLQRENMVMRWSRKRRDRVDELLAREAQAEEDEWTKFHHDELAVKNGLTIAILDTLMMETANVVKTAYGKKRRMMV